MLCGTGNESSMLVGKSIIKASNVHARPCPCVTCHIDIDTHTHTFIHVLILTCISHLCAKYAICASDKFYACACIHVRARMEFVRAREHLA